MVHTSTVIHVPGTCVMQGAFSFSGFRHLLILCVWLGTSCRLWIAPSHARGRLEPQRQGPVLPGCCQHLPGPGPRDGLMTGCQRVTNLPIAWVRVFLEITVISIGWVLGGTIGVATVIFAFGVGPAVSLGLYLIASISNK